MNTATLLGGTGMLANEHARSAHEMGGIRYGRGVRRAPRRLPVDYITAAGNPDAA
jgi:hypothetical protein